MTKEEEDARIEAGVREQLEKIVAEQQQQFARQMELSVKAALKGVEQSVAALEEQRNVLLKELDAAEAARAKAEREGEKMAQEYFSGKQKQFVEAAKTQLLRDLTCMHIEVGKSNRDIAVWLDVKLSFVEHIRQIMERKKEFAIEIPRLRLEGNPKLRYIDSGRGGTIRYESPDASFDMWWEFAGGTALVILDVPNRENWEARTRLPLERREHVLTFIGQQIVEDKISGTGSFIIGEDVITFYALNDR